MLKVGCDEYLHQGKVWMIADCRAPAVGREKELYYLAVMGCTQMFQCVFLVD